MKLTPPPGSRPPMVHREPVLPSVPPPHRPDELEARWFVSLDRWAAREQLGVFGAASRLLLVAAVGLALIWMLAK